MNAMSSSSVDFEESFAMRSIDNGSEWCHWINNRTCPDPEVRFYLYTRSNVDEQQLIYIDDTWEASNLSASFFNAHHPSKIIIHGFRADMFLTPLIEMKTGERERHGMLWDLNFKSINEVKLESSNCFFYFTHGNRLMY